VIRALCAGPGVFVAFILLSCNLELNIELAVNVFILNSFFTGCITEES
jgi:hypothetical protein